jgi:cytochrome c oxidase subunit 1
VGDRRPRRVRHGWIEQHCRVIRSHKLRASGHVLRRGALASRDRAVFAGWYYLFPRFTGWSYSERLGKIHFWPTFIGVSASIIAIGFGPQVLMLAYGPGHFIDAHDAFGRVNAVSQTGTYVAGAGTLVFFINMALALWRRRPAGLGP